MNRTTIEASYVIDDTLTIRSPGKFEAEKRYVPYFWNLFLDGDSESDDEGVLTFTITPEDREQFPELGRRTTVKLMEDDGGFVCEV